MSGAELMKKLRMSMTDIPGEMLLDNKRLRIGREILKEFPDASAEFIVNAYRNYGFNLEKAMGKSPEQIAAMMERQEWIAPTLAKIELIFKDGDYRPEAMKRPASIPAEDIAEAFNAKKAAEAKVRPDDGKPSTMVKAK